MRGPPVPDSLCLAGEIEPLYMIHFFLKAQMVKNLRFVLVILKKNADVCIPQNHPPPRVSKRLQLGTPSPLKIEDVLCGRPLCINAFI